MKKIKILLADDEELFRKGISFLLQREKKIEIVFEASNGNEILDYLNTRLLHPDIILMDLKMPDLNGVEATKIIAKKFPNIKIIALTSYNTDSFIANMIDVGASSYLVKNATPTEMITTIYEVAEKGFYYNAQVIKVIQDHVISGGAKKKTILDGDYFSTREIEMLQCICMQMNAAEISNKLSISARTAEGHRTNLLSKTESKNVAGLVVFAIQNKIVDLDSLSLRK